MSNAPVQILTPTGRLLWGSLYEASMEDMDGQPRLFKSGPKAGQPDPRFQFAVAFPKNGTTHFSQAGSPADRPDKEWGLRIWQTGHRDHPQSAQRPDFAWKVTDGDSATPGRPYRGKPGRAPKDKEGYPGHWVVTFSSSYAPKVCNADGSQYLAEPGMVVPGDWIQVAATVVGNTGQTPGVYVNPQAVALQYKGEPITTGVDAKTLGFGGGGVPVGYVPPTGRMSAPPVAGAPAQGGQPAAPVAAAPVPVAGAVPVGAPVAAQAAPAVTSPSSPPLAVQPHPGILLPPGAPVVPVPAPAAPAVPATPTVAPHLAATGVTWAALVTAGWTESTARAAGHIV